MSYTHTRPKRTVRCRYCGEKGHNKSTCSLRAEQIEELRKTDGDDHWAVARYDRVAAKRKSSGKNRKCSYCDASGHNRATCTILNDHIAITKKSNDEFRSATIARWKELNFGLGSLVTISSYERGLITAKGQALKTKSMIVSDIQWDQVNFWNNNWRYPEFHTCFYKYRNISTLARGYSIAGPQLKDLGLLSLFLGASRSSYLLSDGSSGDGYSPDEYYRARLDLYLATIKSGTGHLEVPDGWYSTDIKVIKAVYKGRKQFQDPLAAIKIS